MTTVKKGKGKNENEYFLTDLKRDVAIESGGRYSQDTVENVLRLAFDKIADKVALEGVPVYLIDFFNFFPKDFAAKKSVHPQHGTPTVIAPYRTVYVKPSSKVKKKLDKFKETTL